jgi:hypothetical protein
MAGEAVGVSVTDHSRLRVCTRHGQRDQGTCQNGHQDQGTCQNEEALAAASSELRCRGRSPLGGHSQLWFDPEIAHRHGDLIVNLRAGVHNWFHSKIRSFNNALRTNDGAGGFLFH